MCSSGAISRRSAGPDGHQDDRDESAVAHWTEREIDKTAFKDARLGQRFGELLRQIGDAWAGAYPSRAKTGRTRRQPTASSLTSAWRKPTFFAATSPPRAPATMIVQALELDRIHLGHRTHTVAPRITCDTAALSEKFHTISYLRGLNRTLRQDVRCRNGR